MFNNIFSFFGYFKRKAYLCAMIQQNDNNLLYLKVKTI